MIVRGSQPSATREACRTEISAGKCADRPSAQPFGAMSRLESNAAKLAEFLARVPGDTVHLLGHSLGCVVIRALLEWHVPNRPGRIVSGR